jgi:hypothetical protein
MAEEFEHAGFVVLLRQYSWPDGTTNYKVAVHRRGARREWRYPRDFSVLAECRSWACTEVERVAERQSRETRDRRREQRIAEITRDYLLGKHVGDSLECQMCGRTLTDPVSIARGIGSECWPRLEDRLAREVPRAAAEIARLEASIAELEPKQELAYWQAHWQARAREVGVAETFYEHRIQFDWQCSRDALAMERRRLADTELLLRAAERYARETRRSQ